jgi:hypothetical protein
MEVEEVDALGAGPGNQLIDLAARMIGRVPFEMSRKLRAPGTVAE